MLGEAEARGEIRGWLWMWMYGVAMSGERTLNPQPNEQPDGEAFLFAIALRELFRGVDCAIEHADSNHDATRLAELQAARDALDHSVPNAKGVRDVLVHFDEYERGEGRLQRGKEHPPRLNVFTADDGTTRWLYVLDNYDYRLDVRAALDAARQLTGRVLEVLSD